MLVRTHPTERLLLTRIVVAGDEAVERSTEFFERRAIPIPVVEELEAPMYVNPLFLAATSATHRTLLGIWRSSACLFRHSSPFGSLR